MIRRTPKQTLWILLLHCATMSGVRGSEERTGKPWIDMDYGPYLTASIEVTPGNIAYKGIAIRLDAGPGGVSQGQQFAMFDTDTLRMAATWDGAFINWNNVLFDGSHGTHSKIAGPLTFENRVGPGWANPATGSFDDNRLRGRDGLPYGRLDHDWAEWKGLYLHGDRVVLSYRVGKADILESPKQVAATNGAWAMARTINIGPRDHSLKLQVAHSEASWAVDESGTMPIAFNVASDESEGEAADSISPEGTFLFDGSKHGAVSKVDGFDWNGDDFTIYARVKTSNDGTIIALAPAEGDWSPDGQTLFVRGGRLVFDIGWIGAVQSKRTISDGKWHDIALVYHRAAGRAQLVIDGVQDNVEELRPKAALDNAAVRIGFTSPDFPEPSPFVGQIAKVRFFQSAVPPGELVHKNLSSKKLVADWVTDHLRDGKLVDQSGNGHDAIVTENRTATHPSPKGPRKASFALIGADSQAKWRADGPNLRLLIQPSDQATRLTILCGPFSGTHVDDSEPPTPNPEFVALAAESEPTETLERLTHGGPNRWTETFDTKQTVLGDTTGPYVVETIPPPIENPYRSWMRLGGFDYFAAPDRMAVATWMGDVWEVEGVTGDTFRWRRIATGMFQPLGLRIVDDQIYVCNRDQITRLHDLNGDGMVDFYENFNNDHQVTEHFHEFAMDLQTDDDGNFYYAKSARHAKDSLVPHHGTLIRVSPDGNESHIVCNGFRAANGVGIGPNGELVTSDQEGHWTPANRINIVKEGGFYGNMFSFHQQKRPDGYEPPVVWLPRPVDRSPAEQLWVASDRWGPINNGLLSLSYGTGNVYLINYERVDGLYQGSAVKLPIAMFPTGVMRGRFHPTDGQLYVCGLFGWSSNRTESGGMFRIRYTGEPLHIPIASKVTGQGVDLTFAEPLDPDSATDPENYVVKQWNYKWTANYGSDHYSVAHPNQKGEDEVYVEGVTLSDDKTTVSIELEEIQPVMQMQIELTIQAADGSEIDRTIYNTINVVPE